MTVNAATQKVEHLGNVLKLIQDGGRAHAVEEPLRIVPKAGHDVRILEQMVSGRGKEMAEQPGLTRTTRSGEHDGGESLRGGDELRFQCPADVAHG